MQILDGTKTSQKIYDSLKIELENLKNPIINLDIIIVGDDASSQQYVSMKQKKAKEIGIGGNIHSLPGTSNTNDVVELINQLNNDSSVTALMVQLPLPSAINTKTVLESIDPLKDADGLTSKNLGLLFHNNQNAIASATPMGVIKLLEEHQIDLVGKNIVIIGRSHFIGLPLSAIFLGKNSTITVCHSYTKNLREICQKADVLVSAVGKKNFISQNFIKENSIVIDIGLSSDPETGKLVGDVDFDSVAPLTSFITPVPGGVGPMTIAALLENTVQIWKRKNNKKT